MDSGSVISIRDSDDDSFHTLIDDEKTNNCDQLTEHQRQQACNLFLNHWENGKIKPDEELRMVKKDYVGGLKEKTTDSPTIVFEKIGSENMELTKKLPGSCSGESSRKKKGNCLVNMEKRIKDENHNRVPSASETSSSSLLRRIPSASETSSSSLLRRIPSASETSSSPLLRRVPSTSSNKSHRAPLVTTDKERSARGEPSPSSSHRHASVSKSASLSSNERSSHQNSSFRSHQSTSASPYKKSSPNRKYSSSSSHRYATATKTSPSHSSHSNRSALDSNRAAIPKDMKRHAPAENSHSSKRSRLSEGESKFVQYNKHAENAKSPSTVTTKSTLREVNMFENEPDVNFFARREKSIKNFRIPKIIRRQTLKVSSNEQRVNSSRAPIPAAQSTKNTQSAVASRAHSSKSPSGTLSPRTTHSTKEQPTSTVPELNDSNLPGLNQKIVLEPIKLNRLIRENEKQTVQLYNKRCVIKLKTLESFKDKVSTKFHEELPITNEVPLDNEVPLTNEVHPTNEAPLTNEVPSTNEVATNNEVTPTEEAVRTKEAVCTKDAIRTKDAIHTKNTVRNNEATIAKSVAVPIELLNEIALPMEITVANDVVNESIQSQGVQSSHTRIQIDASVQSDVFTSDFSSQKDDEEMLNLIAIYQQNELKLNNKIREQEREIETYKKAIEEHKLMVNERELNIEERQSMITERDARIKDRDQKIIECEQRLKLEKVEKDKWYDAFKDREKRQEVLCAMIADLKKDCEQNHRPKAKPRKQKMPEPTSELMLATNPSDFKGLETQRTSPQQQIANFSFKAATSSSSTITAGNPTQVYNGNSNMNVPAYQMLMNGSVSVPPGVVYGNLPSSSNINTGSTQVNGNASSSPGNPNYNVNRLHPNSNYYAPSTLRDSNASSSCIPTQTSSSMPYPHPTIINNCAGPPVPLATSTSIEKNNHAMQQQEHGQIRIKAPNREWSVPVTPLHQLQTQFGVHSAPNEYNAPFTTTVATQSNSPQIPTSSTSAQQVHQMVPTERTKQSSIRTKYTPVHNNYDLNSAAMTNDTTAIPVSQLRNRRNTHMPSSQNGVDTVQRSNQYRSRNPPPRQPIPQQNFAHNSEAAFQRPVNETVFYCLGCHKTASYVCATCRNFCSCSRFCNDLMERNHNKECNEPKMVLVSNL